MEIFKIVILGIVATILINIIKNFKSEYAIYISIVTGIIIFSMLIKHFVYIVDIIRELSRQSNLEIAYFSILLKIVGIAYLVEFGSQICKDAGENSIALKLELAGKLSIMALATPVLLVLMDLILKIIP